MNIITNRAKIPRDAFLKLIFKDRPGEIIEVNELLSKNGMKKRTNLLALVLSITAITFTLFGCSSDTGQKKSIAAPGSATETGGGAGA